MKCFDIRFDKLGYNDCFFFTHLQAAEEFGGESLNTKTANITVIICDKIM